MLGVIGITAIKMIDIAVLARAILILSMIFHTMAFAHDHKAGFSDGYSVLTGGKMHIDSSEIQSKQSWVERKSYDDAYVRRARLYVKGHLLKSFYKVEYDVADPEGLRLKGTYLGFKFSEHARIYLGNLEEPSGLESLVGSNDTLLMERSLLKTLSNGYNTGIMLNHNQNGWEFTAGTFTQMYNSRLINKRGNATSIRSAYTKKFRKNSSQIHAGLFYRKEIFPENYDLTIRVKPSSYIARSSVFRSSLKEDAHSTVTGGFEFSATWRLLFLQSEVISEKIHGIDGGSLHIGGFYVMGGVMLTGEQRYLTNRNRYSVVTPKNKFGALELVYRYSELNVPLENGSTQKVKNISAGVNWHLTNKTRLMLNYSYDQFSSEVEFYEFDTIQFRLQVTFPNTRYF